MKRILLAFAALLASVAVFGQAYTGGVKGEVVNRNGRVAVEGARLTLYQGATELATVVTDAEGNFLIPDLADGMYTLVIDAPDFLETQVQVTVNDGYVKNMFKLSITPTDRVTDVDADSFSEFDMDDSGYNDNPTILFGSNDVFNNIAGYNFSAVRFRARGYASEAQDVYLAGVKLNDAVTGYGPFSLWSGLNEAMRSKETVNGAEVSDFGIGGYNGLTNVFGTASNVRTGLRGSVMTNSALYRLRLMASYATGVMDNGWAFAANVSARLGGNDWIDGVYYRSFAYYLAADKIINREHKLGFVFFATPGQRGAQMASTQEVYDLMGDNMYNANWGYQNGKVRNARVRKTNEPIALLKYDYTPSDEFSASATALFRFGKNGYTALDWFNAQDPRPDYYRNLPSYFYNPDEDYKRLNREKAAEAYMAWKGQDADIVHMNWDRIYQVNQLSEGGRAKYVLQERRTDQRDFNLAGSFKWRPATDLLVNGGASVRINRTEYYQVLDDLLGGTYFVDTDNFAERDFASEPWKYQNDLDYWMNNGQASRILKEGDKYGYDFYAHVQNYNLWASGRYSLGNLSATLAGRIGYNTFWREGLTRKGLFPGQPENAAMAARWNEIGIEPTQESSYGKSDVASYLTYAGKLNVNYVIGGHMRVYANAGYFNDAPHFNQAFLSLRTRNTMVQDLESVKTFSSDLNWQYASPGINIRATGYYTTIMDQSKVMSAYDDLQNAFSNYALSGIDERHYGIELGFKVPTYLVPGLSVQGVLALGRAEYTSTPTMTQTLDNSAKPVSYNGQTVIPVRYWKESPVYKKDALGNYTSRLDHMQQHYVPSTPQVAASIGLSWNYNYWFVDADLEYFDEAYLDMNPLYRTGYAAAGPDGKIYANAEEELTAAGRDTETVRISTNEVEAMATQEKFDPCFLLNLSIGKSFYIQRKYQLGFSFNAKNLLNNTNVKTGGYEQTRMVDNTASKSRYYRFDAKYFYMAGMNYMLNIYFRF